MLVSGHALAWNYLLTVTLSVTVWGGELCEAAKPKFRVADEVAATEVGLLAPAVMGTKTGSVDACPVEMVMA
ncbi:MAG: hypothetical protein E6K96_01430 [Thaumarchaeota archaeon]|nr:MAG: hypothetical protein E6K96_01430 [Nitrososphaerota archaeon]